MELELQQIVEDTFYGVAVEAANTIGSFYDKNDYEKSDNSYHALLSILKNKHHSMLYDQRLKKQS